MCLAKADAHAPEFKSAKRVARVLPSALQSLNVDANRRLLMSQLLSTPHEPQIVQIGFQLDTPAILT